MFLYSIDQMGLESEVQSYCLSLLCPLMYLGPNPSSTNLLPSSMNLLCLLETNPIAKQVKASNVAGYTFSMSCSLLHMQPKHMPPDSLSNETVSLCIGTGLLLLEIIELLTMISLKAAH